MVYPLVKTVLAEYGLSADVILKFHKGNKQYPQVADSQMQFDILDKAISKIRIVLLVQIGKEGWDCKSLTGIILSQEGDCPKNMVLQTSCRCLRQVVKGNPETALIYLNNTNAEKLNTQLEQQHHISLKEFSEANNDKKTLKRYDRTDYLKLPKVDFYQLKINYETLVVEPADAKKGIETSADKAEKAASIIRTTDFTMQTQETEVDDAERGDRSATFNAWLYKITKNSFGTLTMQELLQYENELKVIFDKITYEKDDNRYYSSKYNLDLIEANIRKAFCDKCEFSTKEEIIPEEANLLNISNFTTEIQTDMPKHYYPDAEVVERIIADDKGKLKPDKETQKMYEMAKAMNNTEILKLLEKQLCSHPRKNNSFHYLPYHTDSDFEKLFLDEVLALESTKTLDLEMYYNGDRGLTEFKIKCYKKVNNKWRYIGLYTPDFLIIKRKFGKIHKVIIVETKGKIYANNPDFKDRRTFVETEFMKQNNTAFGYDRFEYLYIEDSMPISEILSLTHKKICEFFR